MARVKIIKDNEESARILVGEPSEGGGAFAGGIKRSGKDEFKADTGGVVSGIDGITGTSIDDVAQKIAGKIAQGGVTATFPIKSP